MKVLVTGGCGFLGSHVCELFMQRGWEVVSFDHMTKSELIRTGYQADAARDYNWNLLAGLGIKMVRGDIRDLEQLMDASSGCDYIVHTAAQPAVTISIEEPLLDHTADTQIDTSIELGTWPRQTEKTSLPPRLVAQGPGPTGAEALSRTRNHLQGSHQSSCVCRFDLLRSGWVQGAEPGVKSLRAGL